MQVSLHSARAVQRPASVRHCPGNSECSPSALRDTHPQPLYMPCDNVGGAHAQCCSVHLLSPHTNGSTNFFATYHQSDVGPLSCQVTLKPVSAPLQRGIRFFQYPTPSAP